MARVLVPVATGVEEMEAVIIIDCLRRAKWEVVPIAMSTPPIVASRGVKLIPDTNWPPPDASDFDGIVLPGGAEGAENLARATSLLELLRDYFTAGKLVAAICAAPTVLHAAGILDGCRATCYPGFAEQLSRAIHVDERVVVDGNIITSQGPGTAFEFAIRIIEHLDGAAAADAVATGLLLRRPVSS